MDNDALKPHFDIFCHIFRAPEEFLNGRHHQLHHLRLHLRGHCGPQYQGEVDSPVVDVCVGHVVPVGGVLSVVRVLALLNLDVTQMYVNTLSFEN